MTIVEDRGTRSPRERHTKTERENDKEREQPTIYLEGETEKQSGSEILERQTDRQKQTETDSWKMKKLAKRHLERDSVTDREEKRREKGEDTGRK